MASTYGNDLRLEEIGDGEQSGTWGATTNTNLELIAEALSFGTEAITTNADTHTTTIADGASDPGRSLYLKYTGTLDSACTITIAPNSINKTWHIENGTSGAQNIIISQGSGANVTIPAGQTKVVYSDGAGSSAAMAEIGILGVTNIKTTGDITVGGDLTVGDDLTVTDDMTVGGTLGVTGVLTGTSLDISGNVDIDGTTNLDAVDIDGAVDMATTLAVGGVVTANAGVVVDNFTLDGTTLALSSGDFTVDVAGDIILDADGGDIKYRDGGTEFLQIFNNSTNVHIYNPVQDKDILIQGNDGGSTVTALSLDMSAAGAATFNNTVTRSLTRGSIDVGNSSGVSSPLAKGAAGTVLTSNGTDLSFVAAGGGGTEFISSTTISNAANFTFTAFDSSKYDNYIIYVANLVPVSSSRFLAQTSANGSSYDTGGANYSGQFSINGVNDENGNTTSMLLSPNLTESTTSGQNLVITIYDPHNSSIYTSITYVGGVSQESNPPLKNIVGTNTRLSNAAILGFRLLFASGNIESGKIAVYGVKKS